MNGSILERVQQVIADLLGTDAEHVPAAAKLADLESWDSLNHLRVVLALEEEFQIHFSAEEIEQMDRVDAMAAKLIDKGAPLC